jgi:hypothetical protein
MIELISVVMMGKTEYLVRQEDGSFLCRRWSLVTTVTAFQQTLGYLLLV